MEVMFTAVKPVIQHGSQPGRWSGDPGPQRPRNAGGSGRSPCGHGHGSETGCDDERAPDLTVGTAPKSMATPRIRVANVSKLFGGNRAEAKRLIGEGLDKVEILQRTGCTIAVHDVSFDVGAGEIFV